MTLDPRMREGIGRSMVWNANRNARVALIRAGIHPGIEPDAEGWYPVSYHNTTNGAYAVQNRVRNAPANKGVLETRVRKVEGEEWSATIDVRLIKGK